LAARPTAICLSPVRAGVVFILAMFLAFLHLLPQMVEHCSFRQDRPDSSHYVVNAVRVDHCKLRCGHNRIRRDHHNRKLRLYEEHSWFRPWSVQLLRPFGERWGKHRQRCGDGHCSTRLHGCSVGHGRPGTWNDGAHGCRRRIHRPPPTSRLMDAAGKWPPAMGGASAQGHLQKQTGLFLMPSDGSV
jgi:hypothetical protein